MRAATLVLFSLLALTACAGREADLAVLAQTGDHDKSCQQLAGEVHSLAAAARHKIDRNHGRDAADWSWARWAPYCGGRRGWP